MQIDTGFGDVIVREPAEVEYPTLLDFPGPVLRAYPKETVIAEKLEALTKLGLLNSRMKDYTTSPSYLACTRFKEKLRYVRVCCRQRMANSGCHKE